MGEGNTLQRRLLGDRFDGLPAALRYQFGGGGSVHAEGRCNVLYGGSLLARLMCRLLRLPRKGIDQPFALRTESTGRSAVIERRIGDHILTFRAKTGRNKRANRLAQRRGVWCFVSIALPAEGGISYRHKSTRLLGIPLPGFIAPKLIAHEWPDGPENVAFDATISFPGGRRLIRLHGWFQPAPPAVGEPMSDQHLPK